MRSAEEDSFRQFANARLTQLRRAAFLLCGDPHAADDLVSVVLFKLYRNWRRVARIEHPDSYLRQMLINAWVDEKRRPWRREYSTDAVPEPPPVVAADRVDQMTFLALLQRLTPRRRAVLVLRYFEDLSVEQTAEVLRCSAGTVKTLTHRALADLRSMLTPQETIEPINGRSS